MVNLILCGGAGTRLWPLSRQRMPKQFVALFGDRSLFEEAVMRNRGRCDRILVAANAGQIPLAQAQLAGLGIGDVEGLVEPVGRNTAPAIALSLMGLARDEIVLVTPSDHRMTDPEAFERALDRAAELARQGFLVTFGIAPRYAETGFGYIEAEGETVLSFKEKPDRATAEAYLSSGRHYWNSGMFVFSAGSFLDELERHAPELHGAACEAFASATRTPTSHGYLLNPSLEAMLKIPATSIDYAVMEKSSLVKVVPCDPGWSDLGSFDALYDEAADAQAGNNAVLAKQSLLLGTERCLVVGGGKPIVLSGVEDLIVIDTEAALLVMKRGASQDVKTIFQEIRASRPDLI
jgi:mannose-1-phosphate guanylyltransferase